MGVFNPLERKQKKQRWATGFSAVTMLLLVTAGSIILLPKLFTQSPAEQESEQTDKLIQEVLAVNPTAVTPSDQNPVPKLPPTPDKRVVTSAAPILPPQEPERVIAKVDADREPPKKDSKVPATVVQTNASQQDSLTPSPSLSSIEQANSDERTPAVNSIEASLGGQQTAVQQALLKGDIQRATLLLEQFVAASPQNSTAKIWLAKIYIRQGAYPSAETYLTDLPDTEARALLGIVYERTERPERAATQFRQLFLQAPQQGRWLLSWAINAENSGQSLQAHTLYQRYLTDFASEGEALVTFAQERLAALAEFVE